MNNTISEKLKTMPATVKWSLFLFTLSTAVSMVTSALKTGWDICFWRCMPFGSFKSYSILAISEQRLRDFIQLYGRWLAWLLLLFYLPHQQISGSREAIWLNNLFIRSIEACKCLVQAGLKFGSKSTARTNNHLVHQKKLMQKKKKKKKKKKNYLCLKTSRSVHYWCTFSDL